MRTVILFVFMDSGGPIAVGCFALQNGATEGCGSEPLRGERVLRAIIR